ncbi:MAG: glycosyltransferase family 10 [Elusimicrobiota bacterium]
MAIKRLAIWVDAAYSNDALFDPLSPLNRDNCLSAYRLLKDQLQAGGWECRTHDVYKAGGITPDAVLFTDMPKVRPDTLLGDWSGRVRKLAVLLECAVIKPQNWLPGSHNGFDTVFTWDEKYIDNCKYFKINFPNPFPDSTTANPLNKSGFCVMITANKKSSHPLELYSEREKTVRWFERSHPGEFNLYGMGWDRRIFTGPKLVRALNRFGALARLTATKYPSYRGVVAEKKPVIEKYRFSICYENAREIPGYITEKIFDCFFAGNIPVYWGAPDIEKYIPRDCFIDRRDFASHEQLYAYMKGRSDSDLLKYIEAARAYLSSPAAYQFSDRYFAETIVKTLLGKI